MVREVRSRTDYILDTDFRLFSNMSIQEPSHNLDHYLIPGCLRSATMREHENYLFRSTRLPLCTPNTPTKQDGLFVYLLQKIPKPKG